MSELPQTRQSLLLDLGRCSDDAWSEFLSVYEDAIIRFCRVRGLQEADAMDVTQEVLSAVHRKISAWDLDAEKGSFRAWLFRVARNITVDSIAERTRKATTGGDQDVATVLAEIPAERDQCEQGFDTEYRRSLFEWASQQVRPDVRDVTWQSFCMTAIEGHPAHEVAAKLGVSVGSVYTAKCRVVARIRSKINELSDEHLPDLD